MSPLSPRTQSLLRAGRTARDPSPEQLSRVRRSLLTKIAAGGAAAGVGSGAASASAASGVGLTGKVVVGMLLLAAGGVGGFYWVSSVGPREPLHAGQASRRDAPAAAIDLALAPPQESEAPPGTHVPSPPTEPAVAPRLAPRAAPGLPAPSSSSPSDALLDEARLLGDAQRQLGAGRGAQALATLRDYDQRFPNGTLRAEAEAARVFALCQTRRGPEARATATRFLRRYPTSPAVSRVRQACSLEGPAQDK